MEKTDTFDLGRHHRKRMRFSTVTVGLMVLGFPIFLPAFADGSQVSINIVGGSEAGQSCVATNRCYEPGAVTVQPRTLVVWTNLDSTTHTVTSGVPSQNKTGITFDSGEISPGGTYSFIFMSAGTFDYFCTIHPWMTGKVIVEANTTSPTSTNAEVPEFGQSALTVLVASLFAMVVVFRNRPRLGF